MSLLTGFLGSGKTTVLNHLLRHPAARNTAVIINEFGAVGLDHELVETSQEDIVLLQSGCVCCTVRGDLIQALRTLWEKRDRDEIPRFDRVVIETTGLADPAPILHTMMTHDAIVGRFRMDGVIVTVDAATGGLTLDREQEAVKQAAMADRLLLTKTDLTDAATSDAMERRLRSLNPAAPLFRVQGGAVDPVVLLDVGSFNAAMKSADVQRWLNAEAYAGHHHHHAHAHDPNRHDDHISAFCVTVDRPLRGEALDAWLEALLFLKGPDVLRIKGIVNIAGWSGPMVIHGVQHVFHPPVRLDRWPSADRRTRLVFVARDLDEAMLQETLGYFLDASA